MAGPSAIGSVKGMPISITSAPAPGRPEDLASEVAWSGSPAVTKVTRRGAAFSAFSFGEAALRYGSQLHSQFFGDGEDVLVAAAAQVHHEDILSFGSVGAFLRHGPARGWAPARG
jgi:hypothetical protein